jgi:hypothetical protein
LDDGHSTHKDRGEKTRDIADYPASERYNYAGSIASSPYHLLRESFYLRQALSGLASGEKKNFKIASYKALPERSAVELPDVGRRGDKQLTGLLRNKFRYARQTSALDDSVVGALRRLYAE